MCVSKIFGMLLVAMSLVAANAGCAPAQEKKMVDYKENQGPARKYELAVRIDNAPGTFGFIKGFMQHDVYNRECLPPPKLNPGGRSSPVPYHTIPFELRPVGNGVYKAIVYTDGMVDEDYYGYGVCKWRLLNIQVSLQATGAKGETLFMADMFGSDQFELGQLDGLSVTLYYTKDSFPRDPETKLEEPSLDGAPDRSRMASWLKDDDLFTITLTTKGAAP